MRVLIVDIELMGLDFALRCIADGHDVRLFQPTQHPIGKGYDGVTRITDWRGSMPWAKSGLVVATGNAKFLTELDRFRDFGFNIFAPTVASARLEIDRKTGLDAMRAVGIDIPHYDTFDTLKEAEAFCRKSDRAYVFKTLGSEDDKSLSYVAKDPADLVGWLQRQQARGLKLSAPCILQEKIDMVAEFGVSGWFGPEGFLPDRWQECFEHKKLCDGEIGPNTGEMGTVCQYVEDSKLADEMLKPMEPILRTLGHRGDFAIGVGIDEKGKAWPFEFTSRLGWPAFFIQCASHKGDYAQWMFDLLQGEDTLKVDYRPAMGVVLAQPPWPRFDGKADLTEGNPVTGVDDAYEDFHPAMMMQGKGPVMDGEEVKDALVPQTCGELVAVVTGLGPTVTAARKRCYESVKKVCFPDIIYRTDVGKKVIEALPRLHRWGFATEMEP